MISLKTTQELVLMRDAGHILAQIMDRLAKMVEPGISTKDLDKAAEKAIAEFGVAAAFKGYRGYPACVCASVNEEVVHGIPGKRKLVEGDIIGLDLGIEKDGFFVDMAKTFPVGKIDAEKQKLIDVVEASLDEAIKFLKPQHFLSEACEALQKYVESHGFSVVRDFVGHGIGRQLHEEPQIPNFKTASNKTIVENGMVICIEPMINAGGWRVDVLEDGWTAVTSDRKPSAHFEHTIAMWDSKAQILTR
ncbi:MAG: type I methionyl aminopeptidase [Candidatus Omnitrophota bacterium]